MLSQTHLAQDDFSSLGFEPEASTQVPDENNELAPVERAGSGDSQKSHAAFEDEIDRPEIFIPHDGDESIRNLAQAYNNPREISHAVDSIDTKSFTDSLSSESIYEPMRFVKATHIPPKRFYRSFWRSATRRILQLRNVLGTDISSADASDDGSSQ